MSDHNKREPFRIGATLDLGQLIQDLVKQEVGTQLEDVNNQLADLRACARGTIAPEELDGNPEGDE